MERLHHRLNVLFKQVLTFDNVRLIQCVTSIKIMKDGSESSQ